MARLFDKCGGYRALHSFSYATLIHLEAIAFCKRFIPYQKDPLGKTSGQMIGAARSGRQNIIEGSERAATSKETEIKLTDVARASLGELLGDFEIYLMEHGAIPWSRSSEEHRKLSAILLEPFSHTNDEMHDYWVYFRSQRVRFSEWLDETDSIVMANALIVLIQRAMAVLSDQVRRLGEDFEQQGGFRERMSQRRIEVRDAAMAPDAPKCPECEKPMRLRKAKTGKYTGESFWGVFGLSRVQRNPFGGGCRTSDARCMRKVPRGVEDSVWNVDAGLETQDSGEMMLSEFLSG